MGSQEDQETATIFIDQDLPLQQAEHHGGDKPSFNSIIFFLRSGPFLRNVHSHMNKFMLSVLLPRIPLADAFLHSDL